MPRLIDNTQENNYDPDAWKRNRVPAPVAAPAPVSAPVAAPAPAPSGLVSSQMSAPTNQFVIGGSTGASAPAPATQQSAFDPKKYLQINTDVYEAWAKDSAGKTADQFAQWHWDTYGQKEGRNTTQGAGLGIPPDRQLAAKQHQATYRQSIENTAAAATGKTAQAKTLWEQYGSDPSKLRQAAASAGITGGDLAAATGYDPKIMSSYMQQWLNPAITRYSSIDDMVKSAAAAQNYSGPFVVGPGPSGGGAARGGTGAGGGSSSAGSGSPGSSGFTPWNVTGNQTVQGQLGNVLNQDGPLMQQARGRAMQQMNERGLINSSLGVQAAQEAVLDRAIQIAQPDAQVNARAGEFNAGQQNAWNLAQQELAMKESQFGRELAMRQDQFGQELAFKYNELGKSQDNKLALMEAESRYNAMIRNDEAFNKQYAMYVDALYQIDKDTNLSAEAKQAAKFQQARMLEDYAKLRGLNINLDFSSRFKA